KLGAAGSVRGWLSRWSVRSPDDLYDARTADVGVTCDERQVDAARRRADDRVEWIAVEAQLVGQIDLLWRDVDRLIRWVAEEIVEEGTDRPAQVDPRHSSQETAFPDHDRRHVKDG